MTSKIRFESQDVEDEERKIIKDKFDLEGNFIESKTIGIIFLDENEKAKWTHYNNSKLTAEQLQIISEEMKRINDLK